MLEEDLFNKLKADYYKDDASKTGRVDRSNPG
jgi:hypothetical protein